MTAEKPGGLLVVADTLTIGNSRRIFDYALAQRLLVIYEMDFLAEAGGLMSASTNGHSSWLAASASVLAT